MRCSSPSWQGLHAEAWLSGSMKSCQSPLCGLLWCTTVAALGGTWPCAMHVSQIGCRRSCCARKPSRGCRHRARSYQARQAWLSSRLRSCSRLRSVRAPRNAGRKVGGFIGIYKREGLDARQLTSRPCPSQGRIGACGTRLTQERKSPALWPGLFRAQHSGWFRMAVSAFRSDRPLTRRALTDRTDRRIR
jgi:hypothetical protein